MRKFPHATLVGTNHFHANEADIVAFMVDKISCSRLLGISGLLVVIHFSFMSPVHAKDVSLPHKSLKYLTVVWPPVGRQSQFPDLKLHHTRRIVERVFADGPHRLPKRWKSSGPQGVTCPARPPRTRQIYRRYRVRLTGCFMGLIFSVFGRFIGQKE